MKRLYSFFFCLLLIAALILPCAAKTSCVHTSDALSAKETEYLDALFQTVLNAYGVEAFFFMDYGSEYDDSDSLKTGARAYLDAHMSGDDAVVFAVSSESYYMNMRGKAGEWLEEDDLDTLYDAIADADKEGKQYAAAVQFYTALNELLSQRTGITVTKPEEPTTERVILPGSVPIPDEIAPTRGDRLVDQADLLSDEEEAALQEKLDSLSEALQFDIVIVTAEHIGTRTPMEFADDYYDYNGFGYGEDNDGVALLISMAERDWWISTCGYGLTALSDEYFMHFISPSDFTYHLKNGRYAKSFHYFADIVGEFVTEAKENEPYSAKHPIHVWSSVRVGLIFSVIAGLIAAAIATYSKYDNYVCFVRSKSDADDYLVGGVHLIAQSDAFVSRSMHRTKRAESTPSSSDSSGSSTKIPGRHVSSSGRTHGGGGGKF